MKRTYIHNAQEIHKRLIDCGWTWTNSYYAGDANWSKPGKNGVTLERAVESEGLGLFCDRRAVHT